MDEITFSMIAPNRVVYDHVTGLFPYSSRMLLDRSNIDVIKRSYKLSGMWEPIVIRASTFEGIAGNHRFIAFIEYQVERGESLDVPNLPVVLIDCNENLASIIGLT